MALLQRRKPRLRKLARYRAIITKLAAYGFQDIVGRLRLPIRPRLKGAAGRIATAKMSFSERLRLLLEDLGPTFVKLGQLMSLRSDLFPDELTEELAKLQHAVGPFPADEAERIIEEDFQIPASELFRKLEPEPLAAASIAQVHRAVSRKGEAVAVKIQRPRIQQVIATDLAILQDLAGLAERYLPFVRNYKPVEIVRQFARALELELDFDHEGRTMDLFRENYRGDGTVHIPEVHWDLTSPRVLTMELIQGIRLSETKELAESGQDTARIAKDGARFILKQIFQHGAFHADPHPGNFIIMDNGVIAPVDFGMVGYLDVEMRNSLGSALSAFLNKDPNKLIRLFARLGFVEDDVDQGALRRDLLNLFHYYYNLPLAGLHIAKMIGHLNLIIREHHVSLPPELALTFKALITVESLGKRLDPRFSVVTVAQPFLRQLAVERLASWQSIDKVGDFLADVTKLVQDLPGDAENIIKKVRSGRFKVKLEHGNLEEATQTLRKSVNRLAFSVVIAGMLIGSSFMMQVQGCPRLFGFPILGLAGYLIAGFLGLWLLIAILRSGRL